MSEFVNSWVFCNLCFKNFDDNGGVLTSCGHFFCNRRECKSSFTSDMKSIGKVECPICKSMTITLSLDQKLPEEVLHYFEDTEALLNKTNEVLRFQEQQKKLLRKKFFQQELKIKELEELVTKLKLENNRLSDELQSKNEVSQTNRTDNFITDIISKQISSSKMKIKKEDQFIIKTIPDTVTKQKKDAISQKIQQSSKLFTPTLASRLQNINMKNANDTTSIK